MLRHVDHRFGRENLNRCVFSENRSGIHRRSALHLQLQPCRLQTRRHGRHWIVTRNCPIGCDDGFGFPWPVGPPARKVHIPTCRQFRERRSIPQGPIEADDKGERGVHCFGCVVADGLRRPRKEVGSLELLVDVGIRVADRLRPFSPVEGFPKPRMIAMQDGVEVRDDVF